MCRAARARSSLSHSLDAGLLVAQPFGTPWTMGARPQLQRVSPFLQIAPPDTPSCSLTACDWFTFCASHRQPDQPARFTFAHRALCAAAIRLLPAAEMVRFGLAVLTFAQRAFCARLILRRAAADMRNEPFEVKVPNAARPRRSARDFLLRTFPFSLQLLHHYGHVCRSLFLPLEGYSSRPLPCVNHTTPVLMTSIRDGPRMGEHILLHK